MGNIAYNHNMSHVRTASRTKTLYNIALIYVTHYIQEVQCTSSVERTSFQVLSVVFLSSFISAEDAMAAILKRYCMGDLRADRALKGWARTRGALDTDVDKSNEANMVL